MSRASLKDRLEGLNSLLEEQGEVELGTISGVATASPDVMAFLTTNAVFSAAVDQAHDKAGDGDWTVVGVDLPIDMAEDLVPRMQAALKETRKERDEDSHYRWSVRTTPGREMGKSRLRLRANYWSDEQITAEAQRITATRQARGRGRHLRSAGNARVVTRSDRV